MGLGGTAKKLQKVVDAADELYAKINDLRGDVMEVRNSIDETTDRVGDIEAELAEQRELLERLAEAEGVDTDLEAVDSAGEETGGADKAGVDTAETEPEAGPETGSQTDPADEAE